MTESNNREAVIPGNALSLTPYLLSRIVEFPSVSAFIRLWETFCIRLNQSCLHREPLWEKTKKLSLKRNGSCMVKGKAMGVRGRRSSMESWDVGWSSESLCVCIDFPSIRTELQPNKMDLWWQLELCCLAPNTLLPCGVNWIHLVQRGMHFIFFPLELSHYAATSIMFMFVFFWSPLSSKIFTHEPVVTNYSGMDGPCFKLCSSIADGNCCVIRRMTLHASQSRVITKAFLHSQSTRAPHETNKQTKKKAKLTEGQAYV